MLKKMTMILVLGLLAGTMALAGSLEINPISPDPDLLKRLGGEEVARLHNAYAPHSSNTALQKNFQSLGDRVTGTGTCLVILWDFVDHSAYQAAHSRTVFNEMLFSVSSFPTGSMRDYYREISYGAFDVEGFVSGWTTSHNSYASYANSDGTQDPGTCQAMIIDAIAQLDGIIDYSQFDNDGPDGIPDSGDDDGLVDAIFFVHAGPGMEESGDTNDIWSHAGSFYGTLPTNDGVSIYRYSVEPERRLDGSMVTIGVFAHEYGHVLGLPDLYDIDRSSKGLGDWDLMSGGSWGAREGGAKGTCPTHMSAWSKSQLGWVTPVVIGSDSPGVVIPPAETNPAAYRIFRKGDTTGQEYFLVENRRPIGFDEALLRRQIVLGLDRPQGLAIYHVDESKSGNSNDIHRLVDLVDASPWFEADGSWHENLDGPPDYSRIEYLNGFNRGDNGDLWPGFTAFSSDSTDWVGPRDRTTFSDESIPSAWDYECNKTGVVIANISDDGLNVRADFSFTPQTPPAKEVVRDTRVWNLETGTGSFKFCNSYAHFDQDHSDGCSGNGGLWFGRDVWDCSGYGNNWDDLAWVTLAVNATGSPSVIMGHKYDLEPGYDYGILETRPAGDLDFGWTQIMAFDGVSGCTVDNFPIPRSVINAAEADGVAVIDVRLRLSSDEGWSAEDGLFCGFGWWIDYLAISESMSPAVDDLPDHGDVAYLAAPHPNPFNPTTTLKYHVSTGASAIRLSIFDSRGRQVRRLVTEAEGGWHEVRWDGRSENGSPVATGLYFARLTIDGQVSVQKMALIK